MIYITGDTHGSFDRIKTFCEKMQTTKEDVMIILGDVGLNYYGGERDRMRKLLVSELPITLFCIHGNHEMRPDTVDSYRMKEWNGGAVFVEDAFPSILFARDGATYCIDGINTAVIGGAYSVDKEYRLSRGWNWFADEQPSDEIKNRTIRALNQREWKIDAMLSHTCPLKYEPIECFLPFIDQTKVDKSTEVYLDGIEDRLQYKRWFCGHYHIDKQKDRISFLYNDIRPFVEDTLSFPGDVK